jgi:hypothetical protein
LSSKAAVTGNGRDNGLIVLDCFREFGRQHSGVELAVQGMDSVSQMKALRR